ncbi:lipase class 3 family protein [Skeletonema marinoi]|uniref:sn-1-specific diacylglycerol lipase n=1 Tax=Skeletonema marinoi TaxID=267567 RepID=A0AAD8Y346_9STRA|nr:lipase class 3 family protein [Skeletonema marinoi]
MLCMKAAVVQLLFLSSSIAVANSSPIRPKSIHRDIISCIPRGGENGVELKRRRRIRFARIHKQIWYGARKLIGRAVENAVRQEYDDEILQEDHAFDELDTIIFDNDDTTTISSLNQSASGDDIFTTTKPPREAASRKGWKRRSLRAWIRKIEHKFLSPETARAINTIQKILAAFPDYGVVDLFGLYSPKEVVLSILALSRLQHVIATRNKTEDDEDNKKNETTIDKHIIEELAYYSIFANVAYGWKGAAFCGRIPFGNNNRALLTRTGIEQDDILMTKWHSKTNRPAFFLIRDKERNTIVLSIRGTLSPRDVLTDLCASCENFLVEDDPEALPAEEDPIITDSESSLGDIDDSITSSDWGQIQFSRAHSGMVEAARGVARMTAKIISDELQMDPNLSLVIVGHSLGGGVAAVLATMWKQRFANRVRSIGFGNPCVFPLAITSSCDNIISVTGEGDPFACFSLGHIADLTKALSKLCSDDGFRNEIMQHTGTTSWLKPEEISEEDYVWCLNAMTFLRKQMNSEILVPPGVIYVMSGSLFDFPTDESESSVKRHNIRTVDPTVFDEMRISPRMFDVSRHVPARYETVLQRIAASA